MAVDMLGTLTASASSARIGVPVAGAIVDPAFHVNMAWPAQSVPASCQESVITPATPHRVLGLSVLASAPAPAPKHIPEWKDKAGFQKVKLLESGEAAVPAIGGRVHDALAWRVPATDNRRRLASLLLA